MPDFINKALRIDAYFDKLFYINLASDTLRNEHMIAQFSNFGIENYERIDAIAIKELPGDEAFRNFNKKDPKYVVGSISCRTSHIQCIKTAKARNYKKVLIFEDDVVFNDDPNKLLSQNYELLNDWDMLYFSGLVEQFFRNQIVGGYAYAVRNTVFDDIINMAEASGMEIDNFYAKILQHMSYNNNQSGKYNIRIIQPFNLISHNYAFNSNIQERR